MDRSGFPPTRLQAEGPEIAQVLQHQQPDKTIIELWDALSLHRVCYERAVLPAEWVK